jgi:hypothetical protein
MDSAPQILLAIPAAKTRHQQKLKHTRCPRNLEASLERAPMGDLLAGDPGTNRAAGCKKGSTKIANRPRTFTTMAARRTRPGDLRLSHSATLRYAAGLQLSAVPCLFPWLVFVCTVLLSFLLLRSCTCIFPYLVLPAFSYDIPPFRCASSMCN